jgi:hypothetical protein
VNVITDRGKPLRLATMNLTVTRVRVGASLSDPDGARLTAPQGRRFIVLDATVTNITSSKQRFEPANLTVRGRNTALWIFDRNGDVVSQHGSDGEDYSVQYNSVVGTLRTPLSNAELYPGVPYSGQLVFSYPTVTLKADHRALLQVNELGRGFGYNGSVGGVRLHL